jgi:diacylglycerol O-acyltransferase / wax synthase
MDSAMIFLETPHGPNLLTNVMLYDRTTAPSGSVSFDDILHHVEQRLHLARAFRERLVHAPLDLDEPYWIEDPDFDLEFHVRQIALPRPGNWRQLCTQIARIAARPLDMTKPLWELYMIEGLDEIERLPPGSFALLLKLHHASIDGISGVEMLTAISDPTPDAEPTPADNEWRPDRMPSTWSLLQGAAVHAVTRPVRIGRWAVRAVPALRSRRQQTPADDVEDLRPTTKGVPRTRFNGPISPHRVLDARWFPFDTVRHMRSGVDGATVNDVALTVVAGAMRLYLTAKGELPEQSLIAMVPLSTRTPEEAGTGGNRVSMLTAPLFTDIGDPLERLQAITRVTRRLKQQNQAVGARTLTEISEHLPGRLIGTAQRAITGIALRTGTPLGSNTAVTNVPGPQKPLYLAGARMVRGFGAGPVLNGAGLIHIISTYCGEILFLFTACREMLPDSEFYADCIEQSFNDLAKATA